MNAPNPLLAPAPCPRLERAINRMVRDLAAPLTLADLAEAAHYSPWYLVRRFQAHYQTTPQAFLWRLRLEVAASLLHWAPRMPIGEVALAVGFSSAATFSRAFNRTYGFTPSAWRRGTPPAREWLKRNLGPISYQPGEAIAGTEADFQWSFTEVATRISVEDWPAKRMLTVREVGDYGRHLENLFLELERGCQIHQIPSSNERYGLIWSDPATTPAGRRRYDAAFEISPQVRVPRGMGEYRLPAGRWAVFHHSGLSDDIGPRWRDLMLTWLPQTGLVPDPSRPRLEHYFEFGRRDGRYDLCLPLMG
ncbi:AraC family transcriptional regulator [Chitinolyticbacter meiyuanensis]|uniref:AraC family transcriptional regulator n=1 Tax=Chitinolyticbacter meiyuanensis TaxID=682798 RepID=UPI0011E5F933|nr:AraC family transcriptional regulator [Chitinolyticbacter meiyuanensis]